MIDVAEAIGRATQFADQIYAGKLDDLRVEEVDSDDDHWLITLGFELPTTLSALRAAINVPERRYKIFRVNKSDGQVTSMKIRQVG